MVSSSSGTPMAAACERTIAPCSVVRSASPTGVSASAPNPVFTPYTGASPRSASTTTERLTSIRFGTSSPSLTRACPCATATTSSMVSALPSTTTSRMIGSLGKIHPQGAGQALNTDRGDAHAAAPLTRRPALDPAELEHPAGDRGGQGTVQVPAALRPVDAGPRELPA